MADWDVIFEMLKVPFEKEEIFFRAGAVSKDKKRAQALAYAEPRVYEARLNEVVGENWACIFKPWGSNRIICELTIHDVTRSSTGEENEGFAPGTAAEAQAFKRACVKFGLGAYLYDLRVPWVDYDASKGRLLETPTLPASALPKPPLKVKNVTPIEPIGEDRGLAMHAAMANLGFSDHEITKIASSVLGRTNVRFSSLSEAEANEVWFAAKRVAEERKEKAS